MKFQNLIEKFELSYGKKSNGDKIKFDKYVNQYVKNKDDLLESLNESEDSDRHKIRLWAKEDASVGHPVEDYREFAKYCNEINIKPTQSLYQDYNDFYMTYEDLDESLEEAKVKITNKDNLGNVTGERFDNLSDEEIANASRYARESGKNVDIERVEESLTEGYTQYKGYYIDYDIYGNGEYTVQYCGDDVFFDSEEEAKEFIDEILAEDGNVIDTDESLKEAQLAHRMPAFEKRSYNIVFNDKSSAVVQAFDEGHAWDEAERLYPDKKAENVVEVQEDLNESDARSPFFLKLSDKGEKISDASFAEELDEEVGRSRAKYDLMVDPEEIEDLDFRIGRMPYDHKQLDRDARAILSWLGIKMWKKRDDLNIDAARVTPEEAHKLKQSSDEWHQITIHQDDFEEAAEDVLKYLNKYPEEYWYDAVNCIWEYLDLAGFRMVLDGDQSSEENIDNKKHVIYGVKPMFGGYREGLEEGTEKEGNHWVNKGDEGTHGEFKTKKEADNQRKAMFANGYTG